MSRRTDTELLDGLRNVLGYVEDGSDTTVRISVDDATGSFVVRVGRNSAGAYTGTSLRSALAKAVDAEKPQ